MLNYPPGNTRAERFINLARYFAYSRVGNLLYSFDFFYPVVLSVGFGFLSVYVSLFEISQMARVGL